MPPDHGAELTNLLGKGIGVQLPVDSDIPPLLEARQISKTFGAVNALRKASLTLREGRSHALVGRNGAGKSTLVSILTGLLEPDQGVVAFDGEIAPPLNNPKAWRQLVACVYQKPRIVPSLTVGENLFLNRQPKRFGGRIDWSSLKRQAETLLTEWSVDVPTTLMASELTVEQRQLVEIARALSIGTRVIVLDEPTAQLEGREIRRFFDRIRHLQVRGVTFLYISHHLQEIYELCTDVTVMRDGATVRSASVEDLPYDKLVSVMVGSRLATRRASLQTQTRRVDERAALEVTNASLRGAFDGVSIQVHEGEIVGLAGLVGSGRGAFGDALAGLRKFDAGEVRVEGRKADVNSPAAAIRSGIGHVPADRHATGFIPALSVAENITLPLIGVLGRLGYVSPSRRTAIARGTMQAMEIVATGPEQSVQSLSGGNQQKVVLGRAMVRSPRVLVLQHPTRGVDVASKDAIFKTLETARQSGLGILVISDEYEELVNCSRIYVMFRGRIASELPPGHTELDVVAAMESA